MHKRRRSLKPKRSSDSKLDIRPRDDVDEIRKDAFGHHSDDLDDLHIGGTGSPDGLQVGVADGTTCLRGETSQYVVGHRRIGLVIELKYPTSIFNELAALGRRFDHVALLPRERGERGQSIPRFIGSFFIVKTDIDHRFYSFCHFMACS